MKLRIVDTTLRDGEQTPGVAFSSDAKVEIAKSLCDLGVDIIEVGIPVMGQEEVDAIRRVRELELKSTLLTWNRLHKKDIDASLQTGVQNIHISVPSSFIQIEKKLRKTPKEVLLKTGQIVEYAIMKGCTVSLGAEDASRANEKFLFKLYNTALNAGTSRLRFADTLGKLSPFDTLRIIQKIKNEFHVDLDFHGHNDFGLATANALAAFKGGAHFISCSVNGLGERAGNTPLEEIVMALIYMEKCETEIKINQLVSISELIEKHSGRILNLGKPVVGKEVFFHESGIHVDGLLKDKSTYQYLDPILLGRTNHFVIGKHSGKSIHKWYNRS